MSTARDGFDNEKYISQQSESILKRAERFNNKLLEEALIALSISAATNPAAELALEKTKELQSCEVHMTHIPTPGDETGLRRMGVNLTSDPNFSTNDLFIT